MDNFRLRHQLNNTLMAADTGERTGEIERGVEIFWRFRIFDSPEVCPFERWHPIGDFALFRCGGHELRICFGRDL